MVRHQHRQPGITEHDLVAGHHTPEDQPAAIADTIATWLKQNVAGI
jgi:hypothetical protein